MYYTPRKLVEGKYHNPACGSGSFLKRVADKIESTSNPPYGKNKKESKNA